MGAVGYLLKHSPVVLASIVLASECITRDSISQEQSASLHLTMDAGLLDMGIIDWCIETRRHWVSDRAKFAEVAILGAVDARRSDIRHVEGFGL